MKPSLRTLWLTTNTVFLAALYLGFIHGIEAVRLLCIAFVWVMLGVYLLAILSPDTRVEPRSRVMPGYIEWAFNLSMFAILTYSEAYLTAIVFVISCVVLEGLYFYGQQSEASTSKLD